MKEREKNLVKYIKKNTGIEFTLEADTFHPYDCSNKDYIVELKIRDKYYKDRLIEVDKCYRLLTLAQVEDKQALYVVADPYAVTIFNLSKMVSYLTAKRIDIKEMPYRTEFDNNKKIKKYCYLLPENKSSYKIQVNKYNVNYN